MKEGIDMLLTSKEASKKLKELETEHVYLLSREAQAKTFLAAVGEDVESCRPEYDYQKYQKDLEIIEDKIIKLKHAINDFNVKTTVDGFDKTIDEMLIYIPQLSKRCDKLGSMLGKLPKERNEITMRSSIIDYRYLNYDPDKAKEDYLATKDELSKAQIALDKINVTKTFEVEI